MYTTFKQKNLQLKDKGPRFAALLLMGFLACACTKEAGETLPKGKHRVIIRLTSKDIQGLDAEYRFFRQALNSPNILQGVGSIQNNKTEEIDNLIQETGEKDLVVISFNAPTPTNTIRPSSTATCTAEVIVDGVVQGQTTLNAATPFNAGDTILTLVETEIK
jgi:hypothetical protein